MRYSTMLLFLLVVCSPSDSSACTCVQPGPPCQDFFRSDAVFIGTVRGIALSKVQDGDRVLQRRAVTFDVERVGRGTLGTRVDVYTGFGGGDCGYEFKTAERYVVYAYRRPDGSLGTGICSRTKPASQAAEDIAYFNALPATGSGATVSGQIKHWEHDAGTRETVQYGPVPDVQVLVRGRRGTFTATTDASGKYSITGIPTGAYDVEALPPPSFSARYLRHEVQFTDARACHVADFSLHLDGRIAGVLHHKDGGPAAGVRLQIVAAERPDEPALIYPPNAITDSAGRFELEDIPPGRYLIGVGLRPDLQSDVMYPPTLLPTAAAGPSAAGIAVGRGERVDLGVLQIPDALSPRVLTGVVVTPDGAPVVRASVSLWDARNRSAALGVTTDEQGRFTLKVFEGVQYTVRAFLNVAGNRQIHASQAITVTGNLDPVRLVLQPR